jgi:hypothetical protein
MASPLGRIYLQSLIASAEGSVKAHRAENHKFRLRIATRRLRKLRAYEAERDLRADALRGSERRGSDRVDMPVFEWLRSSGDSHSSPTELGHS